MTKHLITQWSPSEDFEPHTIAVHAEILAKHGYVWYGKLLKSGKLGITNTDVTRIQAQIKKGTETHLYLYCPGQKPTLHAGLLQSIQKKYPTDPDRIPYYYSTLPYKVPYWFKLTDIRHLSLEHLRQLEFDPISANAFPKVIESRLADSLFDYHMTAGKPWYAVQNLSSGLSTEPLADPRAVFVLMPFADEFTDTWKLGILPTIQRLGLDCRRADDFFHTRDIMDVIRQQIRCARLIIAEMTTNNPNVFYELGYAHAHGKEVVLLTKDRKAVPFDLQGINNIEYKKVSDLAGPLDKIVRAVLAI